MKLCNAEGFYVATPLRRNARRSRLQAFRRFDVQASAMLRPGAALHTPSAWTSSTPWRSSPPSSSPRDAITMSRAERAIFHANRVPIAGDDVAAMASRGVPVPAGASEPGRSWPVMARDGRDRRIGSVQASRIAVAIPDGLGREVVTLEQAAEALVTANRLRRADRSAGRRFASQRSVADTLMWAVV